MIYVIRTVLGVVYNYVIYTALGVVYIYVIYTALGVAYNMKSQLETQLPTVPDALSSTDQCLIKAFVSTTATLAKVTALCYFI